MSERFAILAMNPDGTEDFLEYSNDFDELWKKKNEYQRKERKEWKKDSGEYVVVEFHRTTLKKQILVDEVNGGR